MVRQARVAGAKTRTPGSSGTAILVHQYSGLGSGSGLRMRTKASSRRTVGRHQQVDREHQISGAFPLPDPQCSATVGRHAAREDRSARRRRVAGGAEVPLDAAGEPGVGEREVGELQAPVGEHQIPVGREVAQRPEPAPEARKHQRLQPIIRYPERRDIP